MKLFNNSAIIGIDFSINKSACTILYKDKYKFLCFPFDISDKNRDILLSCDVQVIARSDDKNKGNSISSKMRYEILNANYIADLIYKHLEPYLNSHSYIAFEGISYGSTGDVALQLGGYKFILMSKLGMKIPYENMYTYSPLTVKSIAGCSARGMKKEHMIQAFIEKSPDSRLKYVMLSNPSILQKKTGKWIDNIDDIVDSYWVLQTLREKELIL